MTQMTTRPTLTPEELRARRERLGVSCRHLSALLYLSSGTVGHWEVGRRPIPPYAIRLLEWAEEALAARPQRPRRALRRCNTRCRGPATV